MDYELIIYDKSVTCIWAAIASKELFDLILALKSHVWVVASLAHLVCVTVHLYLNKLRFRDHVMPILECHSSQCCNY